MKVTGRVESYELNNLNLKGRSKPYYIMPDDIKAAMKNFPPGMIVTLTIEKGTAKGMAEATPAESKSYLDDEKAGIGMNPPPTEKPFKSGKEILEQNLKEKVAESAAKPPVQTTAQNPLPKGKDNPSDDRSPDPANPPIVDDEALIRASITRLLPSDRVGYRISLAGMVNSVIEMKKISTDAPKTYAELEAEVKRDAIALFIWCDNMTTQNIKR